MSKLNEQMACGIFDVVSLKESQAIMKNMILKRPQGEPIIMSINGSVAVGKTTLAEKLRVALESFGKAVEIVHTDSFLLSNKELKERNLMSKKGFPDTYKKEAIYQTLCWIKQNKFPIFLPKYSHKIYDIEDTKQIVQQADIVIFEGLMFSSSENQSKIDMSIFLDAKIAYIEKWFQSRTRKLVQSADCKSYFGLYSQYSQQQLNQKIEETWQQVNLTNYYQNILPLKGKSDLIVMKGETHQIEKIYVNKGLKADVGC